MWCKTALGRFDAPPVGVQLLIKVVAVTLGSPNKKSFTGIKQTKGEIENI